MRRVARLYAGESATTSLRTLARDLAQVIECSIVTAVDVQLHDPTTGRYRVLLEGRLRVAGMTRQRANPPSWP